VRISVLGAAGRTGSRVVHHALDRGHDVAAIARSARRIGSRANLTIVEGDVSNPAALASVLEGDRAVISTLGGEPSALQAANLAAIEGAVAARVVRFVLLAQVGVLLKKVRPEFEEIAAAHRASVAALAASGLRWAAACPAGLTDEPSIGSYQAVVDGRAPGWEIGRDDLATFLLDAAESGRYDGHAVGVSRGSDPTRGG
jgi:putative NADH-flavin reductase